MRIQAVTIANLFGIEYLTFAPKTLTVLRGKNGSGKSSVLRAITLIFSGGHDPEWIRKGATSGRVVIELDDGTTISKTVKPNKSSSGIEVLDSAGHVVPAPQTFISQLGESWAIDPGELLSIDATKSAGQKALVAKLLEIMPIAFAPEEVAACGVQGVDQQLDIDGLTKVRKQIEETRRRIGQEHRDAQGTVADFRRSLREMLGGAEGDEQKDWSAAAKGLEKEKAALDAADTQEVEAIRKDANVERQASADEFLTEERKLREQFAEQLRLLNERKAAYSRTVDQAEQKAIDGAKALRAPERDRLTADIATARERAAAQIKAAGIREQVDKYSDKIRVKYDEYARLTGVLESLDRLKQSRLDSLPVPGLDVRDGKAYVDGVEWPYVNRGRLGEVAFQLSTSRAGDLGFLVVDDAEHWDGETWEAFVDYCTSKEYQVLAAKVDPESGPLKIETER